MECRSRSFSLYNASKPTKTITNPTSANIGGTYALGDTHAANQNQQEPVHRFHRYGIDLVIYA